MDTGAYIFKVCCEALAWTLVCKIHVGVGCGTWVGSHLMGLEGKVTVGLLRPSAVICDWDSVCQRGLLLKRLNLKANGASLQECQTQGK